MTTEILKSLKNQVEKINLPEDIKQQKIEAVKIYEEIIPLMQTYTSKTPSSQIHTKPIKYENDELNRELQELTRMLQGLAQKLTYAN